MQTSVTTDQEHSWSEQVKHFKPVEIVSDSEYFKFFLTIFFRL